VYGVGVVIAVTWLASVVTREHSWVDRLWSIMPPVYVAWFAWQTRLADARLVLMTALAIAWGARLTFNFARKGGYAPGGEDYRWGVLKQRMSAPLFHLFNVVFISCFQHALLFLIALPAWVALEHRGRPLGALDAAAAAAFVVFLAGETLADEQQWRFQSDKKRRRAAGQPIVDEFLQTGLFAWSRHPHYLCEMGLWCAFYLFAVAASDRWLHPVAIGPLLLIALFQGSTRFTEELSAAKYPAYADYQRRVPRLLPFPIARPSS
jgi:steroid 5-alpha reductase family enzyme